MREAGLGVLVVLVVLVLAWVAVMPFVAVCVAVAAQREVALLRGRLDALAFHTAPRVHAAPEVAPALAPAPAFAPAPAPAPAPASAPAPAPASASASAPAPFRAFDWEGLIGVRAFAWLGGIALFLGAALFLQYSIQHDLIAPPLRVAIGVAVGAAALLGGDFVRRRADRAGQALSGAGVAILYASIYAARTLYDLVPTGVAWSHRRDRRARGARLRAPPSEPGSLVVPGSSPSRCSSSASCAARAVCASARSPFCRLRS